MSLARRVARVIWRGMLWLMRRRFLRRLRLRMGHGVPEPWGSRMRESANRQDRWARRHGVTVLTVCVQLFFAAVFLTVVFLVSLSMLTTGVLPLPEDFGIKVGLHPGGGAAEEFVVHRSA